MESLKRHADDFKNNAEGYGHEYEEHKEMKKNKPNNKININPFVELISNGLIKLFYLVFTIYILFALCVIFKEINQSTLTNVWQLLIKLLLLLILMLFMFKVFNLISKKIVNKPARRLLIIAIIILIVNIICILSLFSIISVSIISNFIAQTFICVSVPLLIMNISMVIDIYSIVPLVIIIAAFVISIVLIVCSFLINLKEWTTPVRISASVYCALGLIVMLIFILDSTGKLPLHSKP